MFKSIRIKPDRRNISKIVPEQLFLSEILGLVSVEIYGDHGSGDGCGYGCGCIWV